MAGYLSYAILPRPLLMETLFFYMVDPILLSLRRHLLNCFYQLW